VSAFRLYWLVVTLTAASFSGAGLLRIGLERALVQTGILSPRAFAAGLALGEATPGPLAAFTTAIGAQVAGLPGAVAATLGLLTVSLAAVLIIRQIPPAWFRAPALRAALAAVMPYSVAMVLFLAWQMIRNQVPAAGGASLILPAGIVAGVMGGRLRRVPVPWLVLGAVAVGMVLG
jgi:chromate transporter